MKLNKRPCMLGLAKIREEKHGDEQMPALSIPIEGVMLEDDELNAILDDDHAHKVFFNTRTGGKSKEPLFPCLKPLQLKDKYEGWITLKLGPNINDIELEEVRFASITLDRKPGGLTALSFSVQANDNVDKYIAKLINKACYSTESCKGMAESSFYRGVDGTPTHEWYRPEPADVATMKPHTQQHIAQGGLILRKIGSSEQGDW